MENAVIYARYSSHSQGEQSIEGQLARAHEYARKHNYNVIYEYVDRAKTGRNDNREQFQQMLKDASRKRFSVVICWKIDRFGRNREEIAINKQKLRRDNIRLEYVAESIPDSPEGVLIESLLEGMAEYYSKQLSQNIKRGRESSIEKCKALGLQPFGYMADKDKNILIDQSTAPIVRQIFEDYAAGKKMKEICDGLNAKGIQTVRGNDFRISTITQILHNERYKGIYIVDDVRKEDAIPRIIDDETFEKVQGIMEQNKRHPKQKTKVDYFLSGKLFCGHCGEMMYGESGTSRNGETYYYYKCIKNKRGHLCNKKPVKKQWIEDFVIDNVIKIIMDDEMLDWLAKVIYDVYKKTQVENRIPIIKDKLKDIRRKKNNLIKSISEGVPVDFVKEAIDEFTAKEKEVELELQEEEALHAIEMTEDRIRFFLYKYREIDTSTDKGKKALIKTFVNRIYVSDGNITITFNYTANKDKDNKIILDILTGEECSTISQLAPPKYLRSNILVLVIEETIGVKIKIPVLE